jgi:outer membrane protein assembly factor BamB
MLYKDMLIVNASAEGGALVALDKMTGKERWRTPGVNNTWDTPILVQVGREVELVLSVPDRLLGFNPDMGKELWKAEGVHRYVCPSVVAHDGVIYGTGGGSTVFAIKAGGRGDVTQTHVLWRVNKKGSNVPSPIYHEGHLYWPSDGGGVLHCQEAATGNFVFSERLKPDAGQIWASPVLADGKLYIVSKTKGVYVVAARPKFAPLTHNVFEGDTSRSNASIAVNNGQLLLRTDQYLYCIGKR